MMQGRPQPIDAAQATIIVDRCVPPAGLEVAASTLKSVLWCIRGLGAPGSELCVSAGVIEKRTCLSDRTIGKAIACLIDAGILEQTARPAPGRYARYLLRYERLADWLEDCDRAQARLDRNPNAGSCFARTPEAPSHERPKDLPASGSTPEAPSPTPEAASGTPERASGVSKEETALPAKTSSSSSADADAARSGWVTMGRRAGLELGLAGQCAELLVELGWTNQDAALVALERLEERVVGGGVENPVGLFRAILTRPGGPEPSKKAIKRRAAEQSRRKAFEDLISVLTTSQLSVAATRLWAHARLKLDPDDFDYLVGSDTLENIADALRRRDSLIHAYALENWNEIIMQRCTLEAVA